MTGQLNLFDWIEPDSNSQIAAANKPIEPIEPDLIFNDSIASDKAITVQPVIEAQTTVDTTRYEDLYIGQVVRIPLPHEDTELYDFLKFYYPQVINKTGEIEEITFNNNGDCICSVNIKGTKLLFHASELVY